MILLLQRKYEYQSLSFDLHSQVLQLFSAAGTSRSDEGRVLLELQTERPCLPVFECAASLRVCNQSITCTCCPLREALAYSVQREEPEGSHVRFQC
jgi:hypothetical protein